MAKKRPSWSGGRVLTMEHTSRILKDNALGDPHVRQLDVWLPPQYDQGAGRDRGKRFPVLFDLVGAIAPLAPDGLVEAQAGTHGHRSFIELRYEGEPVASGVLEDWLDRPLALAPELTMHAALELHGSEITVTSTVSVGTSFEFDLPGARLAA